MCLLGLVKRTELTGIYEKLQSLAYDDYAKITTMELDDWEKNELLTPAYLTALKEVFDAENKVNELKKQMSTHEAHVKKVVQNQERLRTNIKSMEKVQSTQLVDRYLKDLNNQEDDLIATNAIIDQCAEDKADAMVYRKEVRERVAGEATKLREAMDSASYQADQHEN